MRTVTFDILNENALNLLKELEVLKLMRFHKKNEVMSKDADRLNLSDFSFSKSRKILKDYKGSLSDSVIQEEEVYNEKFLDTCALFEIATMSRK
jgi:hypothetical protein